MYADRISKTYLSEFVECDYYRDIFTSSDDDTCSYSGIGSVEDSESYMDSCSRDYTEADLDDDLTDLNNSDNETPFDVSSHQSHDTLTLQSVSGESDMEPSKGKNQAAPVNYASDELVAEVERRRKKDFGQTESTESLRKQYRITSLLISPTKKTSIGPPLVELEEPLESKPISTDSLEQLPNNSGPLSETTPTTLTCDDGEMDRHCTPTSSPLTPSMFPDHLPHTIHFPLQDEPCEYTIVMHIVASFPGLTFSCCCHCSSINIRKT